MSLGFSTPSLPFHGDPFFIGAQTHWSLLPFLVQEFFLVLTLAMGASTGYSQRCYHNFSVPFCPFRFTKSVSYSLPTNAAKHRCPSSFPFLCELSIRVHPIHFVFNTNKVYVFPYPVHNWQLEHGAPTCVN